MHRDTHNGRLSLTEAAFLLQYLVQLTTRSVLQNEVHSGLIVEIAVETQDMLMSVDRRA